MASNQPKTANARKPLEPKPGRSAVELLNAQKIRAKVVKASEESSQTAATEKEKPTAQKRVRKVSKTPDPAFQSYETQQALESSDKQPAKKVPKLVLKIPVERTSKRDLKAMGRHLADSIYDTWPKHTAGRHKRMPDCIGFWEAYEQQYTSPEQLKQTKADLRSFRDRIPLLEDLLGSNVMIERKKKKRKRRRRSSVQPSVE